MAGSTRTPQTGAQTADHTDSGSAGLTLTRQAPVGGTASIAVDDDTTATRLWERLADTDAFQAALVDAVRDVGADRTPAELLDALEAAEVDALGGAYQSLLVRVAAGEQRAVWELLAATRRLGQGRSPLDDVLGAARLFAHADVTPTVEVRMDQAFRELRASTRRDVCRLLATLADGVEVRVVATGIVQRWLLEAHRTDLPVSREDITPPTESHSTELVETARAALDADGLAVDILRTVAGQSSETMAYSALYAEYSRTESRVRQVIGDLVEHGLIDTFDGPSGRTVELLPAGRKLIDTLDEEIGRQQQLSDCVSEPGKRCEHSRVTPPTHVTPPEEDDHGETAEGAVDVEALSRDHYVAAAASAVDGGVTLVDHPVERPEDGREPGWFYDNGAEQLLVSAEYHNPLQYWVSVARALTSWWTWEYALDEERLDEDVLEEIPTPVLRGARCLGYLEDAEGEAYRDDLQDAREHLLDLTRRLHQEDYDDRDEFRGVVTREALGLASTMVHLLDLAGVDVVREARLPEFTRNYDADRRADLVETIVRGAAIQSTYGEFAAYRQLYETREEKRDGAFTATVDPDDPFGRLIGSFVLAGPGVDDLEGALVDELRAPADRHEEAPEFAVRVGVTTPDRPAFAQTVREMLDAKALDATRDAVSVAEAFTGTPYDAAEAIQALETEEYRREVRLDELRYALSTLDADRILPEAAPSVSKIVNALLEVQRPVTKAELAELADISKRTVRTHLDRLLAADIVREADGGYRLALSTRDERYDGVLPWYATPNVDRDGYQDATVKGVLDGVVHHLEGDPPDGLDAVAAQLREVDTLRLPASVRAEIVTAWPWIGPVLAIAEALAAEELEHRTPERRTVSFGSATDQATLGTPATPAGGRA